MSFQTPVTVASIIDDIENHRYLLPAIQREFVWGHPKIEWLFDSSFFVDVFMGRELINEKNDMDSTDGL